MLLKQGDRVEYIGPTSAVLGVHKGDFAVVTGVCSCIKAVLGLDLHVTKVIMMDNAAHCLPTYMLRLLPGDEEGMADWAEVKEMLDNAIKEPA